MILPTCRVCGLRLQDRARAVAGSLTIRAHRRCWAALTADGRAKLIAREKIDRMPSVAKWRDRRRVSASDRRSADPARRHAAADDPEVLAALAAEYRKNGMAPPPECAAI